MISDHIISVRIAKLRQLDRTITEMQYEFDQIASQLLEELAESFEIFTGPDMLLLARFETLEYTATCARDWLKHYHPVYTGSLDTCICNIFNPDSVLILKIRPRFGEDEHGRIARAIMKDYPIGV